MKFKVPSISLGRLLSIALAALPIVLLALGAVLLGFLAMPLLGLVDVGNLFAIREAGL